MSRRVSTEDLECERSRELLEQQDRLQAESTLVLDDLGLISLLERSGRVVRVGSSVLGLMVSPDIDLHVYCDSMDIVQAFDVMRPLAANPRVQKLRLSDWTGCFRVPELPGGHSWGLRYYSDTGRVWKLDVWFFVGQDLRPAIDYDETVKRQLTPETTLAILRIKDVYRRHPDYFGVDVYHAVLDRGVRTPAEYGAYLSHRIAKQGSG